MEAMIECFTQVVRQVGARIREYLQHLRVEIEEGQNHIHRELKTSRQQFVQGLDKETEQQDQTTLDQRIRNARTIPFYNIYVFV